MTLISHTYPTPLGDMLALLSGRGLCLLEFSQRTKRLDREIAQVEAARGGPARPGRNVLTEQLGRELAEYFAGQRRRFDIPLDLVGTPFQRDVWQALLAIPYGHTRSYAEQARGRGGGQWQQQGQPDRALPPRHRQRRQPDRLWRRHAAQAVAAGAGAR